VATSTVTVKRLGHSLAVVLLLIASSALVIGATFVGAILTPVIDGLFGTCTKEFLDPGSSVPFLLAFAPLFGLGAAACAAGVVGDVKRRPGVRGWVAAFWTALTALFCATMAVGLLAVVRGQWSQTQEGWSICGPHWWHGHFHMVHKVNGEWQ